MIEEIKSILGDAFTHEQGIQIDAVIAKEYVSKVDHAVAITRNGELEQQLVDASKTIEDFKDMDIEGLKNAANVWKQKAEQSEKNAASEISKIQFENMLASAIELAKGKNSKAISALLDIDSLKQSEKQAEDIKAAISEVQKSADYLFEHDDMPPPYASGTGTAYMCSNDEMASVRAAAGLIKEGV